MNSFRVRTLSALAFICFSTAIFCSAQHITILANFDGSNGSFPGLMPLAQGIDGNLYGTTSMGGFTSNCPTGCGTVFKMTLTGTLSTVYNFCSLANCADGSQAWGGLTLGTDTNFYGMAYEGGAYNYGTVFKLTHLGQLTTLHSFNGTDGMQPTTSLVQGSDGNFYGTTSTTAFKITPNGTFTLLYTFPGNLGYQIPSSLIQATDGNFYGTTSPSSIDQGPSTIFRLTPQGEFTILYTFNSATDGSSPWGGVIQGLDGNLYGITEADGPYGTGTYYTSSLSGAFATILGIPTGQGTCNTSLTPQPPYNSNFSGVIGPDPSSLASSIFQLNPQGSYTTYVYFDSYTQEALNSTLLYATNGFVYATLSQGGTNGDGMVYSFDLESWYALLVRNTGKVGQTVPILGQGFIGTTNVSFSGVPATFTVKSDTYLTVPVPAGALTGTVTITSPDQYLNSRQPFRVTPQLLSFDPPSGPPGTVVTITGVSLTQTKTISFGNYAHAAFTVNSDTQVTATVPAKAISGKITLQTPGGTVRSTASFTVTQ